MGLLLDKDNQMCFLVGKTTHSLFFNTKTNSYLINHIDYIAGGTLKDIIHDLSIPLTWLQRLRYAKDIAAGMVIIVFCLFDSCLFKKKHSFV